MNFLSAKWKLPTKSSLNNAHAVQKIPVLSTLQSRVFEERECWEVEKYFLKFISYETHVSCGKSYFKQLILLGNRNKTVKMYLTIYN